MAHLDAVQVTSDRRSRMTRSIGTPRADIGTGVPPGSHPCLVQPSAWTVSRRVRIWKGRRERGMPTPPARWTFFPIWAPEPTVAPTQEPTVVVTAEPTVAPPEVSTAAPTVEADLEPADAQPARVASETGAQLEDIETDFPPVFDRFYSSREHRTCKACGHLNPAPAKYTMPDT